MTDYIFNGLKAVLLPRCTFLLLCITFIQSWGRYCKDQICSSITVSCLGKRGKEKQHSTPKVQACGGRILGRDNFSLALRNSYDGMLRENIQYIDYK